MVTQAYSILLHVLLALFFIKFTPCSALGADACKSAITSPNDCGLTQNKDGCEFPFSNLCKEEATVTEIVNKYEDGNIIMKHCDVDEIDYKSIKDYALNVYDNEVYPIFQDLYPFECETLDDTIASGIGVVLLKSGYPNIAIDHYTKLIEDRGYISCVAWYFGRARAYSKLGLSDVDNAAHVLADYTNALLVVKADKSAKIYEARAEIYSNLGLHAKAYEDYTAAIKLEPNFKFFLFRGVSLVFMEKFSLAYVDLQESLRLNPHQESAMHYLATCLYHMRRMDEAIKMFEAVLLLDPQNTDVMLSLAQAYTEIGDFDLALDYYNKASVLKSTNAKILEKKALLLYDHGNTAEALTGFRNCVSLEPFNRACRVMVAKCYASQGQFYPAIKELTKATSGVGVQKKQGYFEYPATMYLREFCRYIHLHLDMNVGDFDVEKDLHQGFKENWTRDNPFSLHRSISCPLESTISKDAETTMLCIQPWEINPSTTSWKSPYEIAVKWIRLVDLGSPIFWLDATLSKTQTRRFDLIRCNMTRPRYDKYYAKFYHLFSQQCDSWNTPPYDDMTDPQENFYRLFKTQEDVQLGRGYIQAVQMLRSRKDKSKMEGYSLALQAESNLKISLLLELALTWVRVERYHEELDYIWQKITEEYKKFSAKTPSANSHEPIVNLIVSLSYYFLNLLPLSRSSTVVSHSTAVGLLLALGRESAGKLSAGKDLALDAWTSSDHEKFRNILRSWLSFKKVSSTVSVNSLDNVAQTFPTYRSMLSVTQYDLSSLCKVA